jgi:hypothetical protein
MVPADDLAEEELMGSAVKWGIILALTVSVINPIWVLAGMHTNMGTQTGYLALVILLNIVAVILALRETAGSNGYGAQLASGLVLGVVSGIIIFLTSFAMATYVFPEMVPEQIAAFKAAYQAQDIAEDTKQILISSLDAITPVSQAFQGAMGTLFTSLIVGAITGAFLRKKA